MDEIVPFMIVPVLLLVSTISRTVTIIVMVATGMAVLYVQTRSQKNRSSFFYLWTLSSGFYLVIVFELGIIAMTRVEYVTVMFLLGCTCYFFHKMKCVADTKLATGFSKGEEYSPVLRSDSNYCQICRIEVNERFFHSIWWDCCVLRSSYPYYLAGQVFGFAALLFGTNLGLTTVCQPYVLIGTILMPEDCSDVYFEMEFALCFVSSVYGVGYMLIIGLVLIHQIFVYIPKYSEPLWRKIRNMLNQ